MGIFDRKKSNGIMLSNGVDVNHIDETTVCRPFLFHLKGKGQKNFADVVIYSIIEKIFNGLKNVSWRTTEIDYLAEDIINFVGNNAELLIYHYWFNGFVCVIVEKSGVVRLPRQNEIVKDANGRVTNRNAVTIYSQPYQIEKKSHILLLQPLLQSINNSLNNSDFITSNLGLFGIINGKGVPISPAAKDELQAKLKKNYGTGNDQFQFILSNTELEYKPIQIPVEQMKLNDNVDFQIKSLCRFFQLNPDLLFGGSTFSNQSDAIRQFYCDCITPLAEVLLLLARNIYIFTSNADRPSTVITYDLSNVPEFNRTLSDMCAQRTAYLDYLIKLRDAGADVEDEISRLAAQNKDLTGNV